MLPLLLSALLTVSVPTADLHALPSLDAPVVTQALYGTAVTPCADSGRWCEVEMADGYRGWLPAAVLAGCRYAGDVVVWSTCAFLYKEPSLTTHAPIMALPFGTRLLCIEETDTGWAAVRLVDGSVAWVQLGDLRSDPAPLSLAEMVELARQFVGTPYRWGGTSSFGFDCSGLIQTLYGQVGLQLPRDSAPQSQDPRGLPVSVDGIQPGDVIFFEGHVGLALGGGEMVHATPPRVCISPIAERPIRCVRRFHG